LTKRRVAIRVICVAVPKTGERGPGVGWPAIYRLPQNHRGACFSFPSVRTAALERGAPPRAFLRLTHRTRAGSLVPLGSKSKARQGLLLLSLYCRWNWTIEIRTEFERQFSWTHKKPSKDQGHLTSTIYDAGSLCDYGNAVHFVRQALLTISLKTVLWKDSSLVVRL